MVVLPLPPVLHLPFPAVYNDRRTELYHFHTSHYTIKFDI